MRARAHTHTQIGMHANAHTHTHLSFCLCLCVGLLMNLSLPALQEKRVLGVYLVKKAHLGSALDVGSRDHLDQLGLLGLKALQVSDTVILLKHMPASNTQPFIPHAFSFTHSNVVIFNHRRSFLATEV